MAHHVDKDKVKRLAVALERVLDKVNKYRLEDESKVDWIVVDAIMESRKMTEAIMESLVGTMKAVQVPHGVMLKFMIECLQNERNMAKAISPLCLLVDIGYRAGIEEGLAQITEASKGDQ